MSLSVPIEHTSDYQVISFFNTHKTVQKLNQESLPQPYRYLLSQPLLTPALKKYYQQKPIIQTLMANKNIYEQTYSRTIVMLINKNKKSNILNSKVTKVIELAFITMNFAALPEQIKNQVLHTNIPFGQLLLNYDIKITTQGRTYFAMQCDEALLALTNCEKDKKLYGRTNTIINIANNRWLAHVVEILI